MSDANRTALRYDEEASWGEVTGTPTFIDLRETGESLKGTKQTEVSEEIRDDRQIPGVIRTGVGAEGEINFEYNYATYHDFILALLGSAAFSAATVQASAVAVSLVASTGVFTVDAATWTVTPTAGTWVRISGYLTTEVANNGYYKVAVSPAPTTTTFAVVNKDDLVDAAAAAAITIKTGAQATNGVADKSFTIERENVDLTTTFQHYLGMKVESMSLDIPVDGRITGSFGFMGKQEIVAAATVGDGSPTAANENDIVSSANDIQFINIDESGICLMSGSIEVTNNLRPIRCAGEIANHEIGIGRFGVTGDLELLFEDNTQKTKFLAHTEINIAIAIEDAMTTGALGLGNGTIIEIPSAQFSDDETVAQGVDTELSESTSFEALMNTVEDITMRFIIWPAE